MQLAVAHDGGEGLLLDRGGAELDAVEHGNVQDIHAGIDAVADELNRLFHETVDAGGMAGLVDDNAVLGGLLDLGNDNRALFAMGLVEVGELLEGIVADDIGVEDEEGAVVLG